MDAEDVKRLAQDITLLVRKEIDSAREEMTSTLKSAGFGAGMLSGSAIAALMMLGSLTAVLILALATVLAPWLSALIVTIVWGAIAALRALSGKKKMQEAVPLVPSETIESIKEDIEWAKHRRDSERR